MIAARIESVNVTPAKDALEKFAKSSRDLSAAFKELRPLLVKDQVDHQKKQAGPGGKWPPRARSTEARARRTAGKSKSGRRKRLGRLLGKLPKLVKVTHNRQGVLARAFHAVQTLALVHQEGATVNHGARVPARPYLWISEALAEQATRVVLAHVLKGWKVRAGFRQRAGAWMRRRR